MKWHVGPIAATAWVGLLSGSLAGQSGTVAYVLSGGGAAGSGLGHAAAAAGDVDGDGHGDVIVGFRTGSGIGAGTAEVSSGADGSLIYLFTGLASQDHFGQSVSGAGDVNGDGYADVIVGAASEDANGIDSGAAHVFSGRDGSLLYHFVGDFARARFGYSVAGAGDVDGDGFDDLIVGGQPDANTPQPIGHVRVLSGSDGSILLDIVGPVGTSRLGCSVAGPGDVDGDGVPDILAGDWRDHTVINQAGSVSLFSGADGSLLAIHYGDLNSDRLGLNVSGAGDVNGDGTPDLLASSPWANGSLADVGMVRVWSGADGSVLYTIYGDATLDFFGGDAAGVGDFDADGFDDFAVGAFADDDGGTNAGSVRVFSGADGSELWRMDGDSPGDEFGHAVACAGDIDGDGGDDLICGAPADDQGGGALSGAAFAVLGATPPTVGVGPVVYCQSGPNAWGPGARIGCEGSASVAASDLVLTADGAAPWTYGLFFTGGEQTQLPFQRGYLCIRRPLQRASAWVATDETGSAASPLSSGHCRWTRAAPAAGETWNFQFIYRDAPGHAGKGQGRMNLSDALSVTFVP